MRLTKKMLMERRRSLEADLIAINGALQQVDWCLEMLESPGQPEMVAVEGIEEVANEPEARSE